MNKDKPTYFHNFLLLVINILHIAFILFVICTPFTNILPLLLYYIIFIPFLIFHWLTNNDLCALTVAEQYIRNDMRQKNGEELVNMEECYTYKFIGPIYNFVSDYSTFSTFTYILTISLWCLVVYKVYNMYKSSNLTLKDFFLLNK